MRPQYLYLLLFAIIAFATVTAQNEDDIPVENDNQFPPENDNDLDLDVVPEGSGAGLTEHPIQTTTEFTQPPPPIEDIISDDTSIQATNDEVVHPSEEKLPCPEPCVCNTEGDSNNFIVDCSDKELEIFPTPLDPRTTTLNVQNNKLTEIPKGVSTLKTLKVLNANNNYIMELVPGSVSELPELVTLRLANNRLIEYPKDLKNSLSLTQLTELDLGGNDMRTLLTKDIFSNLDSLRKLTLPKFSSDITEDLCGSLNSLETVCIESCDNQIVECPDAPQNFDEELFDAALPGTIALSNILEDNVDPAVNVPQENSNLNTEQTSQTHIDESTTASPSVSNSPTPISDVPLQSGSEGVALHEAVLNPPQEANGDTNEVSATDTKIETADTKLSATEEQVEATGAKVETTEVKVEPTEAKVEPTEAKVEPTEAKVEPTEAKVEPMNAKVSETNVTTDAMNANAGSKNMKVEVGATDVKVGATTTDSKTGGVDKSVIGIIVAGMVLVVAAITIKKNWSSIKKRFSSTPRLANERAGGNLNGTTPEEVPLQDKSPV